MLLQAEALLPVLPPIAAYRRDLARLGVDELSPRDAEWLTAAVGLSHLDGVAPSDRPERVQELEGLFEAATRMCCAPSLDGPAHPSPRLLAQARILAEQLEDVSAWHFAYSVLADAERNLAPVGIDRGRLSAQRARIHWKRGALSIAEMNYREVLKWGRMMDEPELIARAYVGYAALSQLRGNYPAVERWARRASSSARNASLESLNSFAEQLLMVSAAKRGDHDEALEHGWAAFSASHGDMLKEAEMLLNIAQLLELIGEHDSALTGFVACLERRPPVRLQLPAWGGVATSASALGDARLVSLAAERIADVSMSPTHAYAQAGALAEAAQAVERVAKDGARWRTAALALAARHGFHEITYRLSEESTDRRRHAEPAGAPQRPLSPEAAAVVTAVTSLADVGSSHVLV
jgi:tetratricopeptide (TPR) repeat protein